MRTAFPIPLGTDRAVSRPGSAPDLIARKTIIQSLSAWGVTYLGVLSGISMLGRPMDFFEKCLMAVFLIGAPIAGIALAFIAMRRSLRTMQVESSTPGGRVMSIVTLVISLSFFIVPISVVSAVSLWAFILPAGS